MKKRPVIAMSYEATYKQRNSGISSVDISDYISH